MRRVERVAQTAKHTGRRNGSRIGSERGKENSPQLTQTKVKQSPTCRQLSRPVVGAYLPAPQSGHEAAATSTGRPVSQSTGITHAVGQTRSCSRQRGKKEKVLHDTDLQGVAEAVPRAHSVQTDSPVALVWQNKTCLSPSANASWKHEETNTIPSTRHRKNELETQI